MRSFFASRYDKAASKICPHLNPLDFHLTPTRHSKPHLTRKPAMPSTTARPVMPVPTFPFASAWGGPGAGSHAAGELTFPNGHYPAHPIVSALVDKINSRDGQAFSSLFAENAVVHDEGRTHTGRPAILQWMQDAIREYNFTIESYTLGPEKSEMRKGVE